MICDANLISGNKIRYLRSDTLHRRNFYNPKNLVVLHEYIQNYYINNPVIRNIINNTVDSYNDNYLEIFNNLSITNQRRFIADSLGSDISNEKLLEIHELFNYMEEFKSNGRRKGGR